MLKKKLRRPVLFVVMLFALVAVGLQAHVALAGCRCSANCQYSSCKSSGECPCTCGCDIDGNAYCDCGSDQFEQT
jgi:hypothetical protein